MVAKPTLVRLVAVLMAVACLVGVGQPALAQPIDPPPVLVPIGASYEADTLQLFAEQAVAYNGSNAVVELRLLPITYASDPYSITAKERAENLELLQRRAGQLLAACNAKVTSPVTCDVTIIDMQVRDDADNPDLIGLLVGDVDGVYIPGGDQTFAMMVIADTPAESALSALVMDGVPLGGNSAGAAVQSYYMIAGYTGDNSAWDGLREGAVDLWYGDTPVFHERGLSVGLTSAVIEQHVLQRGRLARLLQATNELPDRNVGVGLDNATAAVIEDGDSVHSVTGLTAAAVVDQETYGAAPAPYPYPGGILSIHNVALHLLPPGGYSYDLSDLTPALNGTPFAVPSLTGRNLSLLRGPTGSGTLIVAGDFASDTAGPVMARFAEVAASNASFTLVLGLGDPNGSGQSLASNWKEPLRRAGFSRVESASLTPGMSLKALDTVKRLVARADAIMVVSDQQEYVADLIDELGYVELAERWGAGVAVLMDNGAAAAAGEWMSAEPTPTADELEDQASESFLVSGPYAVDVTPGLGMISGAAFEPRALYDYRYGRLISMIHHVYDEELVTFGLDRGTAVEITPTSASALGRNGVLVVDGRYGDTAVGANNAIAATWLIVDTFAPDELID